MFLLDAMDEMPRDHYQERLESLSELRRQTPNKILFACRKLDFRESFPFLRANIQPFDWGQIRDFLRRTLGALGKTAAWEVVSPSYPLRHMAHNPFFLKLLSEFYKKYKRLPDSRAELLQAYEKKVFERAEGRKTFPRSVSLEDFNAVLARLAYLTTTVAAASHSRSTNSRRSSSPTRRAKTRGCCGRWRAKPAPSSTSPSRSACCASKTTACPARRARPARSLSSIITGCW